ncbi:hypothetical protein [Pseudomonas sp. SW-3]|uniref:hypothetical protein n=1 Tax=Pseudomonas sp. SW-3 TaxID=147212 RepID=UPI00190BB502|nr:hypothetical protein [Pseudomonas sp. SW-3]QQO01340.1 hypothetical protein JIO00_12600 [Pseudomonas sp. SW-3]
MTGQPQEANLQPPSFEARAAKAQLGVLAELHAAEERIALIYGTLLVEPMDGQRPDARRLFAILESLRALQKLYPPVTLRKGQQRHGE